MTSRRIPTARPADEGAVVPFLVGEQVETAVAKEGSSSAQPAAQHSLERRVQGTLIVNRDLVLKPWHPHEGA